MSLPEESLFQEKILLQQKFQSFLDNKEFEDKSFQIINEIKNLLLYNYSKYGFSAIEVLLEILDSFLMDERKILIKLLKDFENDLAEIKELTKLLDNKFMNIKSLEKSPQEEKYVEGKDDSDKFGSQEDVFKSENLPTPEPSITPSEKVEPSSEPNIDPSRKNETEHPPSPKPSMDIAERAEPEITTIPQPPPIILEESLPKSESIDEKPSKPSISDKTPKKKKKRADLSKGKSRSVKSEEFAKETHEELDSMNDEVTDVKEKVQLNRFLLVDYFKQMNPNSVYAFHITISKKELQVKKRVTDVLTGETREQLREKFELVSESPVTVDVSFPGCLTTPLNQKISTFDDKTVITFFVTPLAKGSMKGTIILVQDEKTIFKMDLKYKVADQRISKIVSVFGLTFAALPTILDMIFGIDPNDQIVNYLTTSLPNLDLSSIAPGLLLAELGIGLFLLFLAGLLFFRYKGKRDSLTSDSF
ncbi:MAG: hypothetical protein HeimC3_36360 [Candidatus Heimdallarchaeota archaeon LC_3]|nr:MAG: hypothetical protein HeimC3_36360 [Candidatus Heimdallarchaeota archaeon LC_3]